MFVSAVVPTLTLAIALHITAMTSYGSPEEDLAQQILEASGVEGGLIVHVNCGDGTLTAALRSNDGYIVHGLDTNPNNIEQARAYIQSLGIYGEVSVECWDGNSLPYIDNLVNLVVSENLGTVPMDEVMRVLCPNGVAYIKNGQTWDKSVKPKPEEIDEWTHYLHDANNNAVSHDSTIGPLRRFQWTGSPRWSRHHDHMASVSAYVSAGGRVFYIIDEGSKASVQLPSKWWLYARDAFNGTILWKKPITSWMTQLWPYRSGPALLPRRLVAHEDRVYVTLGLDGTSLSELDAATGETIRTYSDTDMTEEIIFSDGVLFVVVKDDPNLTTWNDYVPIHRNIGFARSRVAEEWSWDEANRWVTAIEPNSGTILWRKQYPAAPLTLAADANSVYLASAYNSYTVNLVCLNRNDGNEVWNSVQIARQPSMPTRFGPTLVVHDNVVLFEGGDWEKTLTALSASTGQVLWETNHPATGFDCPYDLLVADGLAWIGATEDSWDSGIFTGWDPSSGDILSQFLPDVDTYWFHHRCYRAKATDKYLLTSRMGVEFIDHQAEQWEIHHWVRGGCLYGIMPANGLIYTPPHDCACYFEALMSGFCALAAAHSDPNYPQSLPDQQRLQPGPAYGEPNANAAGLGDWPTYRSDPNRSSYTKSVISADLELHWQSQLEGKLTSPVIANGRVYVASVNNHTVHAINEDTGVLLWSYTAGGRVDSPPSIYKGRVIFGCADGWVYCLRATDGVLIWRFQAAPENLRLVGLEQIESVWPLHGSVLVLNDTVYCVAGRSMFLDGGLRFLQLDPATGNKLNEVILDERDPNTNENLQVHIKGFNMPVALPDILSSDGEYIYMHSQRFDLQGNRQEIPPYSGDSTVQAAHQYGTGMHLFSPAGFLDDNYMHRGYWVWGKSFSAGAYGWYRNGAYAPCGRIMAFDNSRVFGYGRRPQYFNWSTILEYHLFCAEKYPLSESIEYHWTNQSVPILSNAMVLSDNVLFIAGAQDVVDEEDAFDYWSMDPYDPDYDPNMPAKLEEQDALLEGQNGALLWAVSTADGNKISQYNLESLPVWDGMAAANGRLYLSLKNGKVQCFTEKNYPPVIDAGQDKNVYPMAPAVLDGNVIDDGLPRLDPNDPCSPPIGMIIDWSRLEGPGPVIFGDPSAVDTNASFSQWGQYILRLSAFDGAVWSYDDINIHVCRQGDLDCDDDIDIFDLNEFAAGWLVDDCNSINDWCSGADQTAGETVNFADYAIIALNWLNGADP